MNAATGHFAAAAFHFLPALVWGILAWSYWGWLRHARRPRSQLLWILPLLTSLWSLHYVLHGLIELTPTEIGGSVPALHEVLAALLALSIAVSMPMFRHLVPLLAIREETPSARWLFAHYGAAALVGLFSASVYVLPESIGTRLGGAAIGIALAYGTLILALTGLAVRRQARRGNWPRRYTLVRGVVPAAAAGGLAVLGVAAGLGLSEVLLGPVVTVPSRNPTEVSIFAHTVFGLAFAAPFAVTMLGRTIRVLLLAGTVITTVVLIHFALPRAIGHVADPELRALLDLGGVAALVLLLVPGRAWLENAIRRVMFRHGRRCREELQAFLPTLAPDLGASECCRRALGEMVRVMQLRGAAILLADGSAIASGSFSLAPIERVWPRGPAADLLPDGPFEFYSLREERLREALSAASVALVLPVVGPRSRWGHLFVSEGVLSHVTQEEQHVETLATFATQLALVLEATELLGRAVAVERSLAHAEKLAAIGELAARIAHEIRNPVTAARSLAQQLSREPDSPLNAEHAQLILTELERVERQVAALLRFARREEFRFEPTDLAELTRKTVSHLGPRLEAAGVAVTLAATDPVTVRADREKIRQVLINLIENAIDALHDAASRDRRLDIEVGRYDGVATLRVADNGPGVPPDALPRLFEPFFSLKPDGTGLGLAIAKRTVDAHGGRIEARAGDGPGLSFRLELPLGEG